MNKKENFSMLIANTTTVPAKLVARKETSHRTSVVGNIKMYRPVTTTKIQATSKITV